jgi:hypothetical protein
MTAGSEQALDEREPIVAEPALHHDPRACFRSTHGQTRSSFTGSPEAADA